MPELMPWHKNWLVEIDYDRVDLVKEGANSQAHIKLFKTRGESAMELTELLAKMKPEHAAEINKVIKLKDEEIEKAKKAAKDAAAAATAKTNTDDGDPEDKLDGGADDATEKLMKSIKDPAIKAFLQTQITKAKVAEEVVKTLKDKEYTAEAITKAKEVPNLGAEEQILVSVYKKLKDVDSELCDNVFGIFKAASALVAAGGVLTEVGKGTGNAEGLADENTAWAAIEKAAEPIAIAKGIKKEAAISEVIQSQPALYDAYVKAQLG
jgi:hypothetical protein